MQDSDLSDFALDRARTAVIVIDMQNDFCKPEGFFGRAGHDVSTCQAAVDATVGLVAAARELGISVFWTKTIDANPVRYTLPPLRVRVSRDNDDFALGVGGKNLFQPGTWGCALVDELVPNEGEVVIEKTRYDAFHNTNLENELRASGIDVVALAGVTTNCCVDTTARTAFVRDFNLLVLGDCVAGFKNEWDLHEATLRNLALLFGVVSSSAEFAAAFRAVQPAPVSS